MDVGARVRLTESHATRLERDAVAYFGPVLPAGTVGVVEALVTLEAHVGPDSGPVTDVEGNTPDHHGEVHYDVAFARDTRDECFAVVREDFLERA